MSAGRRGRATLAIVLAVVGGVVAAGGTAAPWVRIEEQRDIGGVPVPALETVGGMALAPGLLPIGLAAIVVGLALLVARGRLRVVVSVLLLGAGAAAGGLALLGLRAAPTEGDLAIGVFLAGLGTLLLVAAGVLGLRPAPPARLPARYDLDDRDDADDEWRLASGDEPGAGGAG
jgi:hypothetical protein